MFKKSPLIHNKEPHPHVKPIKIQIVKKALSIILLLILSVTCISEIQAQNRKVIHLANYDHAPYHFGFLLGVNYMTYNVTLQDNYQSIERPATQLPQNYRPSNPQDHTYCILGIEPLSNWRNVGFSVGVIGDLRLADYFNLRFIPTLSIGPHRNIVYTYYEDNDKNDIKTIESEDINSNFVEFPIHVKYRSKRYNNIAAYLIGGLNPRFYLSRKKLQLNNNEPALLQTSRGDLALELGSGFDIYNQWFKMGIEIKMSFGIFNVLKTDETSMGSLYNAPFKEVKNKQLQVSLTFE
jgi:hypothetical protein